jgi:hypothetical protein
VARTQARPSTIPPEGSVPRPTTARRPCVGPAPPTGRHRRGIVDLHREEPHPRTVSQVGRDSLSSLIEIPARVEEHELPAVKHRLDTGPECVRIEGHVEQRASRRRDRCDVRGRRSDSLVPAGSRSVTCRILQLDGATLTCSSVDGTARPFTHPPHRQRLHRAPVAAWQSGHHCSNRPRSLIACLPVELRRSDSDRRRTRERACCGQRTNRTSPLCVTRWTSKLDVAVCSIGPVNAEIGIYGPKRTRFAGLVRVRKGPC